MKRLTTIWISWKVNCHCFQFDNSTCSSRGRVELIFSFDSSLKWTLVAFAWRAAVIISSIFHMAWKKATFIAVNTIWWQWSPMELWTLTPVGVAVGPTFISRFAKVLSLEASWKSSSTQAGDVFLLSNWSLLLTEGGSGLESRVRHATSFANKCQ